MELFAFWLLVTTLAGLVALAGGVLFYLVVRPMRKLENRTMVMLKVTHQSVQIFRSMVEKIDQIACENKNTFNHHDKAFEHQSVLISSLNRQIKNLDAMLSDGGLIGGHGVNVLPPPAHPSNIPKTHVLPGRQATGGSQARQTARRINPDAGGPGSGNNTILLNQLLMEKRAIPGKELFGSEKVAKLSTIFGERHAGITDVPNLEERKVSNG